MSAYLIVRVDVTDPEKYQNYMNVAPGIFSKYGGKALARTTEALVLEGPEEKRKIVLFEFDSLEQARECYYSEEYQAARKLREGAAIGEIIAVDGIG